MINNNPYNIPQKPLKQSKVYIETSSVFPLQINRKQEEVEYKYPPQMIKRSAVPYFLENSMAQMPRTPFSPQPIIKSQPLQVSNVSQWESGRQFQQNYFLKELNEKVSRITSRIDDHQRKLSIILQVKKHQQSSNLSDSTTLSHDNFNIFFSKQMEKNSQPEIIQNSTEILQKMRSSMKQDFIQQKTAITQELINSFKDCLNNKFIQQEQRISDCISQFGRLQQIKLQAKLSELKIEIKNQINIMRDSMPKIQSNACNNEAISNLKYNIQNLALSFDQSQSQYYSFKDYAVKNILLAQNNDTQIRNLREKMYEIENLLQKRQLNTYQGFLNVSTEKSPRQSMKIVYESYINAKKEPKVKINEFTYFIDSQGFLLDHEHYYILDYHNNKIKISQNEIIKLKQVGILII